MLPSMCKISPMEYVAMSRKISRMLTGEMKISESEQRELAEDLGINDLIKMTLERWYIYNPKVLILFEPFAQCDANGVSIVKTYIDKFRRLGTSVVIIKTRGEYIEEISDQIISID